MFHGMVVWRKRCVGWRRGAWIKRGWGSFIEVAGVSIGAGNRVEVRVDASISLYTFHFHLTTDNSEWEMNNQLL
jgi:hypothetical protein